MLYEREHAGVPYEASRLEMVLRCKEFSFCFQFSAF
jgi:hypothetical protein